MLERIRELAKERGISLNFICKKLGVASPYFLDIEKTGRKIPESRVKQIAEILFTTPEYLRGETDNPERPSQLDVPPFEVSEDEFEMIQRFRSAPEDMRKAIELLLRQRKENDG